MCKPGEDCPEQDPVKVKALKKVLKDFGSAVVAPPSQIEVIRALGKAFDQRADHAGLKKGTKTRAKMELEFVIGAFVAVEFLTRGRMILNPMLPVLVSTGHSISSLGDPDAHGKAVGVPKDLVAKLREMGVNLPEVSDEDADKAGHLQPAKRTHRKEKAPA